MTLIMLTIIMLNVVMLTVIAPENALDNEIRLILSNVLTHLYGGGTINTKIFKNSTSGKVDKRKKQLSMF